MTPASAGSEAEERYSDFADATGFHTQAKMARGADGTLWMTYVVPSGVGDQTDVLVLRGDMELPRVSGGRGDLSRPSLALDAEGTLHLAWTERAEEDREVFAARYVDGAWRDIIQLSGGEGYAGFPSLAAGPDGRVHVAWYGFDGTFYQPFYREWRDGRWAPATQLSSGPLDANNPSLVLAPDGAVHVAWYKDEGHRYSVWHARRAPEGPWGLPERVPGTVGDALNVALAIDSSGLLHAVWDERLEDSQSILHATRPAAGWTTPTPFAAGAVAGEYAAIARRGDGVLVVWADASGALWASDLAGAPAPFLGGAHGRHPSLMASGDGVDVLWAEPGDEGHEIRHLRLEAGCDVTTNPPVCPDARVPAPWWVACAGLVACSLALLRRSGQRP